MNNLKERFIEVCKSISILLGGLFAWVMIVMWIITFCFIVLAVREFAIKLLS